MRLARAHERGRSRLVAARAPVERPPKQTWLETLLAQVGELVEVDLERALGPTKLAPERPRWSKPPAMRVANHRPASSFVWSNSTARSTSPTSSAPRA